MLVPVEGTSTLLTKHYKGDFRKVTAQAFQHGTGLVALTMSTVFCTKQIDFISHKTDDKTVNCHTLPLSSLFRIVKPKTLTVFDIDESFVAALGVMVVTAYGRETGPGS